MPQQYQEFEIAGGSIVGTDHVGPPQLLLGKNNQDAYAIVDQPTYKIGIVCDGCGSGSHSEAGSQLGAIQIATALDNCLVRQGFGSLSFEQAEGSVAMMLERVRQDVLAHLRIQALTMGSSLSKTVNEYFLFTAVGAVLTQGWTAIFTHGDGVFRLNGEEVFIPPEEGNQPLYMAYALTGSSLTDTRPELLQFRIHRLIKTWNVNDIVIGSDGAADFASIANKIVPGKQEPAGDLSQFLADKYFAIPDAIRRRLAMINTRRTRMNSERNGLSIENGLLPDDTTVVAIRRKPAQEG